MRLINLVLATVITLLAISKCSLSTANEIDTTTGSIQDQEYEGNTRLRKETSDHPLGVEERLMGGRLQVKGERLGHAAEVVGLEWILKRRAIPDHWYNDKTFPGRVRVRPNQLTLHTADESNNSKSESLRAKFCAIYRMILRANGAKC
ncbi:unnamed protein product [Peronospora belbahrii]|uniref:RxLR effector protein n=1 Tax=Peronospora belbahrii TaxID=622444 RepID=A0AAU9KTH4_9STRA|nr:unnamed protein product [Peronospora belbahrii]CAH0520112.1 unnamed protein product [Peronospora belbahrii]